MTIKKIVTTKYIDDTGFSFTFEPFGDPAITKTPEGYEARYITRDDNADGPGEWGDTGLFLVGYHRQFWVEAPIVPVAAGLKVYPADRKNYLFTKAGLEDYFTGEENQDAIFKEYYIFPLEAYIHSGVRLSLSREGNFPDRQWDVSQLGAVLVSRKEWPDEGKAREAARDLVDTWNEYLSGEVYGIIKETYDHDKNQLDHDSCWGFYGEKYALEAVKTDI